MLEGDGSSRVSAIDPLFAPDFDAWLGRAGYSRSVQAGVTVIADEGGEIRYFLRCEAARWVLTTAQRAEEETVLAASEEKADAVRLVIEKVGGDLRAALDLPPIHLPYEVDDVAPGYTVEVLADGWAHLVELTGSRSPATFRHTDIPFDAVGFSWYAQADPAEMRAAFERPDAAPLFARFVADAE